MKGNAKNELLAPYLHKQGLIRNLQEFDLHKLLNPETTQWDLPKIDKLYLALLDSWENDGIEQHYHLAQSLRLKGKETTAYWNLTI